MKKHGFYLLVVSLIFCPLQGLAADQAVKPAPELGRLFFTPNERASLDIIRKNSKAPDKIIKAEESNKIDVPTEDQTTLSKPIKMQGYVSRRDGKNTVWVNDKAILENTDSNNITIGNLIKNTGQVQIKVDGAERKSITLKPGQIYDPNSEQVYNHMKDVPVRADTSDADEALVDKIGDKLSAGVDELKKKILGVVDLVKPKPDIPPSSEK